MTIGNSDKLRARAAKLVRSGHTYRETARRLGVSDSTVRVWLGKARRQPQVQGPPEGIRMLQMWPRASE